MVLMPCFGLRLLALPTRGTNVKFGPNHSCQMLAGGEPGSLRGAAQSASTKNGG